MKLYSNDFADVIKKTASGNLKALLMHGPNQGFITSATEALAKKLDLRVSKLNYKEISAEKLKLLANSQNFFAQRELLLIQNVAGTFNKDMKSLFTEPDFFHFICFAAADSLPTSGIRKFFEEQKHLASIGCYYENEQTIAKMILQQCKKINKAIDEEALFYLKSHLKGDNQIIKSELGKLFAYTNNKSEITKEDVIATLSQDLLASGDEMCIYFVKKEANRFLKEVERLKEQGINEVLMIRALLRYYMNIYEVSARIEDGENIERAIKTLSPPIFFKYVSDFKQVLRKYSSKDALIRIAFLQKAEIQYKTNPKSFDLFKVYLECHEGLPIIESP